ncbi:hypothetical protein HZA99_03660 [Candidatus Woesearchaeota archaeon]|nr:hypothetical protein [Candidatus Woesearchaeota archaeon]
MNSLVVFGLIKRLYPDFDMSTFEKRLKLQKIVYLLQAQGINLGYSFRLYLYGPYCQELAKTAYYVEDFKKVNLVGFEDPMIEQKFESFVSRITPVKDNIEWLEIASTIHLFTTLYLKEDTKQIIKRIQEIKPKYTTAFIEQVWTEMKGWIVPN